MKTWRGVAQGFGASWPMGPCVEAWAPLLWVMSRQWHAGVIQRWWEGICPDFDLGLCFSGSISPGLLGPLLCIGEEVKHGWVDGWMNVCLVWKQIWKTMWVKWEKLLEMKVDYLLIQKTFSLQLELKKYNRDHSKRQWLHFESGPELVRKENWAPKN